MIVVVDERAEVAEAYKTTIGREGHTVASFRPDDFLDWMQSSVVSDLASVEAVVLGDCEARESLTRGIKNRMEVPAIALSDTCALEATLRLFQAGIDDVVRKPVHAREIIARIGAIRRRYGGDAQALWSQDGLVIYGDDRDPEANGRPIQIPRRERRILEYLASSRGRRVTRAQIFASVYGVFDEAVEECVVESHISKLRKKLRTELGFDPIDTQRFLGYQLMGRMVRAA